MQSRKIMCYGEILWDLLPDRSALGGAPYNAALRLSAFGNSVAFVSAVGDDDLGRAARAEAAKAGMDVSFIQSAAAPTGTVRVQFNDAGQPWYDITADVAYDHITLTDPAREFAAHADCICYGVLAQRSTVSRETLQNLFSASSAPLRFCDINLRKGCYNRDSVVASIERANILKLNDEEAPLVAEMLNLKSGPMPDQVSALIDQWNLSACVVTLGDRGAFALSQDGDRAYDPGYRIETVDTVGAGDAFSAGFIHSVLQGESLLEAVKTGNVLGAVVAAQPGASLPITAEMVDRLFQESSASRIADGDLAALFA
jgi:fructokinase